MNKTEVKATIATITAARNERLKLDRESAKLKQVEEAAIDLLIAAKVPSGTYGTYLLEAKVKPMPRCTDWPAFWAFVRENNAFELMHKRLTESALAERKLAGDYTPGIVYDDKVTYTITAA